MMYLIKINKSSKLCGGIIIDINSIAEMYKSDSLDESKLNGCLKKISRTDVKQIEKESRYFMKTVNVYADRGNGNSEICIDDIKDDVKIKINYNLSYSENVDGCSLDVTGFQIAPIPVVKVNRKSLSR